MPLDHQQHERASRKPAWRTAALLGEASRCEALVDGLRGLCSHREVLDPEEPALWDTPALWLHHTQIALFEGASGDWVVAFSKPTPAPLTRSIADLFTATPVDAACVIHEGHAPWSDAHARWWTAIRDAEVPVPLVVLDRSGPQGRRVAEAESELRATIRNLGVRVEDGDILTCDLDALACLSLLPADLRDPAVSRSLSALLRAWGAAPPRAPFRETPSLAFGARLLCSTCEVPVTEPLLIVSEAENLACGEEYGRWIKPGFCLPGHSQGYGDDRWYVSDRSGFPRGTDCARGHHLGHRWRPYISDQGGMDPTSWTVLAIDKTRVELPPVWRTG